MRCLEQLRLPAGERARTGQALAADLGHLGAIAAAAAIRAGAGASVTTAVRDGAMHLPTLGRLVISPAEPPSQRPPELAPVPTPTMAPVTVTVEVADNTVTVQTPDRQWTLSRADMLAGQSADQDLEVACWQPVRTLTAPGISVTLEDTDP